MHTASGMCRLAGGPLRNHMHEPAFLTAIATEQARLRGQIALRARWFVVADVGVRAAIDDELKALLKELAKHEATILE
eukprot:2247924-Rhodomonas_salina.1